MRNEEHYKDPTPYKTRVMREAALEEMDSLRKKYATIETVSEASEQERLMEWAALNVRKYPPLRWLFHIPNGGYRNPIEAVHFKRLGVKAGAPDLFLPFPADGCNGLFIEMKSQTGRPTALQKEWIKWLNDNGYMAVVCYGMEQAVKVLEDYLR